MALKLSDLILLYLLSFLDDQTLSLFLWLPDVCRLSFGTCSLRIPKTFPSLKHKEKNHTFMKCRIIASHVLQCLPPMLFCLTLPLRAGNVYFIHCCIHSI